MPKRSGNTALGHGNKFEPRTTECLILHSLVCSWIVSHMFTSSLWWPWAIQRLAFCLVFFLYHLLPSLGNGTTWHPWSDQVSSGPTWCMPVERGVEARMEAASDSGPWGPGNYTLLELHISIKVVLDPYLTLRKLSVILQCQFHAPGHSMLVRK